MTAPEFLWARAIHVRNTWGHNCTILLFASDYKDNNFTTINITVPHGRNYLPMKTYKTFKYIYDNHMNDSGWFFKADDDTYAYMDNLRRFLNQYDTNKPVYFGYQWYKYAKQVCHKCYSFLPSCYSPRDSLSPGVGLVMVLTQSWVYSLTLNCFLLITYVLAQVC